MAENDPELRKYFLRTADFQAFCSLNYDLVLGVKGSGKSAISRMLTDRDFPLDKLDDVDVLPILDVNSEVLLRKLSRDLQYDSMRAIWMACFASVVGSHLVREYGATRDLKDLSRLLTESGLAELDVSSTPALTRLLNVFSRVTPAATVQVTETGSPIFTATFNAKPSEPEGAALDLTQVPRVLEQIEQALAKLRRRCLVVIDRLDEAFLEAKELEGPALRSLLQSQLDVKSISRQWKVATFLRPDILGQVTSISGLRSMDHLRVLPLSWTNDAIRSMIGHRLRWSLGIGEDVPLNDSLYGMIPRHLNMRDERDVNQSVAGVYWLSEHSAGHPGVPSPRNAITLLDLAIRHARQGRERPGANTAIATPHLVSAWRDLSKMRLTDTLQAEYPELREILKVLHYSPVVISRDRLMKRIRQAARTDRRIEPSDLVESGLLATSGPQAFRFNRLYWHALDIKSLRK